MRGRSAAIECVLGASALCLMSASSFAASICWIDHITKADGGVNVYFSASSFHIRMRGSDFSLSNGVIHYEDGHTQNYLFVKYNSDFHASTVPEDSCSYKVTADGAIGKLTAKAENHLVPARPESATQIFKTDGTVSPPQYSSPNF